VGGKERLLDKKRHKRSRHKREQKHEAGHTWKGMGFDTICINDRRLAYLRYWEMPNTEHTEDMRGILSMLDTLGILQFKIAARHRWSF
jgi:hypothetical protein